MDRFSSLQEGRSFLAAGIAHFITTRCPQRFVCTSYRAECRGAWCRVQSAVCCSLQQHSFVQREMRNEGNGKIRWTPYWHAGLFHLPSNPIARDVHFPPLMARLQLCQLASSGAGTTMVRVEWIERALRGLQIGPSGGSNPASLQSMIRAHTGYSVLYKYRTPPKWTVSQELHLVPKRN